MSWEAVTILSLALAVLAVAFAIRLALRRAAQRAQSAASGAPDVPGVIALPPLIYLAFLAAGVMLEAVLPTPWSDALRPARYVAGGLLVLAGVVLGALGTRRFRAAGTNIPPTLPATTLVVSGPYRWSRNPMYLAMTLIYAGIAVAAGSLWTLALLVPALLLIRNGVIAREEAYLERKFGEPYRLYKASVRRWL